LFCGVDKKNSKGEYLIMNIEKTKETLTKLQPIQYDLFSISLEDVQKEKIINLQSDTDEFEMISIDTIVIIWYLGKAYIYECQHDGLTKVLDIMLALNIKATSFDSTELNQLNEELEYFDNDIVVPYKNMMDNLKRFYLLGC
jgi:hypothetical protein